MKIRCSSLLMPRPVGIVGAFVGGGVGVGVHVEVVVVAAVHATAITTSAVIATSFGRTIMREEPIPRRKGRARAPSTATGPGPGVATAPGQIGRASWRE